MPMPGRNMNSGDYRYGFNGKEKDNEWQGEGNIYDYGFRIYDPRLGRFLSVDPLTNSYPWLTPYQYASNRPIVAIDLDGLESVDANGANVASDPNEIQLQEVVIIAERTFWQKYGGVTKIGISTALDFIPFVGTAKGIVEAFTGKDLVTGEKLSGWERALGIIPIVGKLGRGAKAVGKIADGVGALKDIKRANTAIEATTSANKVRNNYERGKAAEKFLQETYGGTSQGFKVGDTWRYVDNLVDGVAQESKVGRVSASSFTKAQIDKDVQLLLDGRVDKVEWNFFTSSKTGKGGYTDGFKKHVDQANEKLRDAGKAEIKLVDQTSKSF